MPHKDPTIAAASKHAYYLAHKDEFIERSKQRRLKLQNARKQQLALQALLPKVVISYPCCNCGVLVVNSKTSKNGKKCNVCIAKYHQAYRVKNSEGIANKKAEWKAANLEYVKAKDRSYALANPEKKTVARKKWSANNPGKDNACKQINAQARKKRIPTWLSADDKWMIEQAYELAALRTKLFGFQWHVDHIIPLNGKRVSGLHIPTNLQVIPAVDNLRKSNRMEIA